MAVRGLAVDAPADGLTRRGLRRVLVVLCVTTITSWGVLYYAFPVLAPSIARDTGRPVAVVTAAFSGGLVVSALVGIPVGRLLDRYGPRWVMTAGSVLGAGGVAAIALSGSPAAFFGAWLLTGAAMSGTLYPPGFAALTRWWGRDRVRALTTLTMVGGLASTVFAPLSAALLGHLGWRGSYLVLASVLAVVTIPAHLVGLRGPWPAATAPPPSSSAPGDDGADPRAVARSRPFLVLATAVCLGAFTTFAVAVNQVPLLIERGLSTQLAAWALGLSGVGQVAGRLGYTRLAARLGPRPRGIAVLGLLATTTALLALLPGPSVVLVVVAVLTGSARGLFTLVQATAVSDRWHPRFYGRLNGLLSAPATAAVAISPWAGSAFAVLAGGYPPVFALLAVVALAGALLFLGSVPAARVAG